MDSVRFTFQLFWSANNNNEITDKELSFKLEDHIFQDIISSNDKIKATEKTTALKYVCFTQSHPTPFFLYITLFNVIML